jgi:A/G-specific adenine glycosylase
MKKSACADPETVSKKLLKWWATNQRKFPWRETRDPYHILISEILLHRTKAEQVKPIYAEFVAEFPTIGDLANGSFASLKTLLNPIGLYWRTRLLHEMATTIVSEYGTEIPFSKNQLESLPGVGQYIAAAVRCFAFNYPEPLLDTNTVRILGRIFGLEVTDASRRKKPFQELAQSVLDRANSREFNYALIDLGALICKPKKPLCSVCPLNQTCLFGLKLAERS